MVFGAVSFQGCPRNPEPSTLKEGLRVLQNKLRACGLYLNPKPKNPKTLNPQRFRVLGFRAERVAGSGEALGGECSWILQGFRAHT